MMNKLIIIFVILQGHAKWHCLESSSPSSPYPSSAVSFSPSFSIARSGPTVSYVTHVRAGWCHCVIGCPICAVWSAKPLSLADSWLSVIHLISGLALSPTLAGWVADRHRPLSPGNERAALLTPCRLSAPFTQNIMQVQRNLDAHSATPPLYLGPSLSLSLCLFLCLSCSSYLFVCIS